MDLDSHLSRDDAVGLLELVQETLYCRSEDELKRLFHKLKDLIAFDFAICGIAEMDGPGKLGVKNPVNISYPPGWIDLYFNKGYINIDPILIENFTHFGFQVWSETYAKHENVDAFVSRAEDFGLKKGVCSGLRNDQWTEGSIFSLGGQTFECNHRTEAIVRYMTPHLHQVLARVVKQKRVKKLNLTPREKEVIQWVKHGKSSWETSKILGISARTVTYHMNNIKKKLDAITRAQAVAVALEQGLIDLD